MMDSKTKQYLLYGTAVLTVIAAIFAPEEDAQQSAGVTEPVIKQHTAQEPVGPVQNHVSLTLSRQLQENRVTLSGEPSDLFYVAKPPPPKPPKPEPPKAPPLPFVYMGKFIENGQLTIFLTREDKPYVVHAGDILDGQYHVDMINPPIMEITYIPLKEKQSLNIGATK